MSVIQQQAIVLQAELAWLSTVIDTRLKLHFGQPSDYESIEAISPPDLNGNESLYAVIINHYPISFYERITLLLALVPHIKPQLLDVFFVRNALYDKPFTEFGGVRANHFSGFLPSCETALFIMAGNDMGKRLQLASIFQRDHFLFKHNILKQSTNIGDDPNWSRQIMVTDEFLGYFLSGVTNKPHFSAEFPAKSITTKLEWDDLVLPEETLEQVQELNGWVEHGEKILYEMGLDRKIKPGYRTLFYGPPGTGKTLTASLLGKSNDMDVYRIDLSMVVSKYIGETEKNLASVFDLAENKNWILFFDEADALFGKRTATKDSNDRHANQEVSYLLQRIEDFPGLIILASNLKANIDEAFSRRFQSIIHFPMPEKEERLKLWQQAFEDCPLDDNLDFEPIAEKYELAGGAIINVLRYATLLMLRNKKDAITQGMVIAGIKKEFRKEGKTMAP